MKNLLLIIDMQEGFRSAESESILSNLLKLKKLIQRENSFFKICK